MVPLNKDEYDEPRCVLADPRTGEQINRTAVPMQRVVEKFEEYCDRKDFAGAERHLKYWLEEAKTGGDIRGQFSIYGEMMGYYRKQGRYDDAVASVSGALSAMERLGNEESISGATCHVNCGTVYDTFRESEEALRHFRKAEEIFGRLQFKDMYRLGSLYNNMALALADLERFGEAMEYYGKAMEAMKSLEGGELEQAITYLNMADCLAMEKGLDEAQEQINGFMEQARALFDTGSLPRDGYYAFVCEKCAPGFDCYGFFDYGEEIQARADEIYAKINGEK